MKKTILVVDVGGTHVKLMISRAMKRKFKSGPRMTPRQMVSEIKQAVEGWKFEAISIGFPSPVREGRIMSEPKHLGKGWVGFNFSKALGKPAMPCVLFKSVAPPVIERTGATLPFVNGANTSTSAPDPCTRSGAGSQSGPVFIAASFAAGVFTASANAKCHAVIDAGSTT